MPEVEPFLHSQPKIRPVTAELPKPESHLRTDGSLARQDPVEGLPADLKLGRHLGNTHSDSRKHILTENRAWMNRLALSVALSAIFSQVCLS